MQDLASAIRLLTIFPVKNTVANFAIGVFLMLARQPGIFVRR